MQPRPSPGTAEFAECVHAFLLVICVTRRGGSWRPGGPQRPQPKQQQDRNTPSQTENAFCTKPQACCAYLRGRK